MGLKNRMRKLVLGSGRFGGHTYICRWLVLWKADAIVGESPTAGAMELSVFYILHAHI